MLLALVFVPADGTDATNLSDEYWCYGDDLCFEYDGESREVRWEATDSAGSVVQETAGGIFRIDASGYDELYVTQTVTTDQGRSVRTIKVNPLHLNVENYSVVFFDGPGGGIVDVRHFGATSVCRNGKFIEMPDPPVSEGRVFGGWFEEDGGEFTGSSPVLRDYTLYADWLDVYSVIFMSEGEVYSSSKVVEGGVVELPEPVRIGGKVFAGWYSDRGLTSEYDGSEQVMQDRVVYAKWVDIPRDTSHGDSKNFAILVPLLLLIVLLAVFRLKHTKRGRRPVNAGGRFGRR